MKEERYLHSLDSVSLSEVVREEYRNYQIYTLMDRAIPYLQDGLKPGQRRILYTLWRHRGKGLMKVSSATGLILTLHPHGPQSVESSIVNMAQDYTFSNNYPLIDKKGYFGERMETQAAASRYIECKLGKVAEILLFDDMNQVEMVPNYDEKAVEPVAFLPKLPLMLLNGAEGIGTGFSSVIPSFHHKDIIASIVKTIETGRSKKLRPFVRHWAQDIEANKQGRLVFPMKLEEREGEICITEIPRNYDAARLYRFLSKFIEDETIKDFIDSSVENDIKVELLFKRGARPSLEEIQEKMKCSTSLVPNYTLISERGVKIFRRPEEIIQIFTQERLKVVKLRYELLSEEYQKKIRLNSEIVRFINNKEYIKATVAQNRQAFVDYLKEKKFTFRDYLADMPIYRMAKEEVAKRLLLIKEEKAHLKESQKIARSPAQVRKKLVEELRDVEAQLTEWEKKDKGKGRGKSKGKGRAKKGLDKGKKL